MEAKVSLVRSSDFDVAGVKKAVYESIDLLGYKPSKTPKTIAIKPNLCYYWDYTVGETTDPRVISALIDYIRDNWNENAEIKIIESDASAMRARHAFKMLGYERLAEKKSVELINLSEREFEDKVVRIGNREFKVPFSSSLLEYDMVINVPKLKIGPYASGQAPEITCALKNFFGLISEPIKVKFHPMLNEYIVAINKLVRSDLTLVDGIVALGKHPIKLGLVIAGTDNISVDAIASQIMGFNPKRIKHLRLAKKENSGTLRDIEVLGADIKEFQRIFPKKNRLLFKIIWKSQLSLVHLYAKITGDTIPPMVDME